MELTHAELATLQDLIVWIAQNKPRGFTFPPALSIVQLKMSFILADTTNVDVTVNNGH